MSGQRESALFLMQILNPGQNGVILTLKYKKKNLSISSTVL